jgi:hypothetical protein
VVGAGVALVAALVLVAALWPLGVTAITPTDGYEGAVVIASDQSAPVTGEAFVVFGPMSTVEVTYANGTTRLLETERLRSVSRSRDVAAIVPADGIVLYRDGARIPPGEARTLVTATPHLPQVTVLASVRNEAGRVERSIAWNCEVDLVDHVHIKLHAKSGASSGMGCAGWEEALP